MKTALANITLAKLVLGIAIAGAVVALLSGAAASEKSHTNPVLSDPALELARLRNEGAAQFESGIGLKKALAAFEAALKLQPRGAIELHNLGTTERKLGNAERASELLQRAMLADPRLAAPAYTLGLVHRTRGETAAAIAAFEAARKRAPAEPSVHYQLGRLYREQQQEAEALQSFVDALQFDPQHTGAMYQLYLYYQEHQEPERAKAMFNEFSRVKRALTVTRKELNDDESTLARPLAAAPVNKPKDQVDALVFDVVAAASEVESFDIRDVDDDGLEDLLIGTRKGAVQLYRNQGGRGFSPPVTFNVGVGSAILQVRGETLVRGERARAVVVTGKGVFVSGADLTKPTFSFNSVSSLRDASNVTAADVDHDGDVDLIIDSFRDVLIGDGAGGFKTADYLGAAAAKGITGLSGPQVALDILQRNAVDFVLYGANGQRKLLVDQLGGRHAAEEFGRGPSTAAVRSAAAADFDNDGGIDLLTSASEGIAIDYHEERFRFAPRSFPSADLAGVTVGDFDNDGWKDVLSLSRGGKVNWLRNTGARSFSAMPLNVVLPAAAKAGSIAADLDGDGRLDAVVMLESGDIDVLWNTSKSVGRSTRIALAGVRSAPSSLHSVVEVRRGGFYEKYVSEGRTLHLPLGSDSYAEVVRISWPNGFVESKLKVDAGQRWAFAESERVSGSCPSVFAWDGGSFRFVTDAFISGPMGVPMGRERYFPVDHDEYIKIPGELLRSSDDQLRIAITEELREAVFLDRVRLLAVDHPAGSELYPNEYLLAGDFPKFKLHVTGTAQAPVKAVDQGGRDVTDLVATADRRYPHGFRRLQYEGLAEANWVAFQLPAGAAQAAQLRLFLTGWFHYFESTSLVAAAQREDLSPQWPQIEYWENGTWRKVTTIGIPSGKDKTVVVDLTGRLPLGAERLRIHTNLALYWDRIAIDLQPEMHDVRVQSLYPATARLRFKGFSSFEPRTPIDGAGHMPQPERFVYSTHRFMAPWNPLDGSYTRFGAVDELLLATDSRMAVFGSGDEILLKFDANELTAPAAGWRRDYLLHLDGYVKDGDKYTAHSGNIEPAPYAGMSAYPYADKAEAAKVFSADAYRDYVARYQTRRPLRFTGPTLAPVAVAIRAVED